MSVQEECKADPLPPIIFPALYYAENAAVMCTASIFRCNLRIVYDSVPFCYSLL